jgi:hypothetical protein
MAARRALGFDEVVGISSLVTVYGLGSHAGLALFRCLFDGDSRISLSQREADIEERAQAVAILTRLTPLLRSDSRSFGRALVLAIVESTAEHRLDSFPGPLRISLVSASGVAAYLSLLRFSPFKSVPYHPCAVP